MDVPGEELSIVSIICERLADYAVCTIEFNSLCGGVTYAFWLLVFFVAFLYTHNKEEAITKFYKHNAKAIHNHKLDEALIFGFVCMEVPHYCTVASFTDYY